MADAPPLEAEAPSDVPAHQVSMPFLQASLTHQGCLSPAQCRILSHGIWTLPACPAVPSLSSWLVFLHMGWSERSC